MPIYYQSDYAYTGSVQTFTAPVDGYYIVDCVGSRGGGSNGIDYGKGGHATGTVHFEAGRKLYVYVGGIGTYGKGGWPNAGNTGNGWPYGNHDNDGWGGGGSTHILYEQDVFDSAIIVAGGGGGSDNAEGNGTPGGGDFGKGGDGGGLISGCATQDGRVMASYKATQTSGYQKGQGQNGYLDGGGGGGGYWGGPTIPGANNGGGAGGSGFVSGMQGCVTLPGWEFTSAMMEVGTNNAAGHCSIVIYSYD